MKNVINRTLAVKKNSCMYKSISTCLRIASAMRPFRLLPVLMVALFCVNEMAWGNSASNNGSGACSNGNIVIGGNHATFTFDPNSGSFTDKTVINTNAGYYWIKVGKNSSNNVTLSWSCNGGQTIKVTAVSFKVKLASGGRAVFNGTTKNYDSGWFADNNYSMSASNNGGLTSPMTLTLTNTKTGRWDGDVEFQIDDISFTYTITPDAPGVNPTTKTVNVTVDANDKKTVGYKCFSTSDHFGEFFEYAFDSNPDNAGHMSGDNFYATDSGTYKIKARIKAEEKCHIESSWSYLTITVNPLSPSFTATNGSVDISYTGSVVTKDLRNLISDYDGNSTSLTFEKVTKDGYEAVSNATITDGYKFSATKLGKYRIKATYGGTKQYRAVSKEFDVTVGKRTPTFIWAKTGENDHIYAGDVLTNVAQAKYGKANVDGLAYSYSSGNTGVVVVDEDKTTLRVQSTGFTTAQNVTISVSTEETAYYLEGSGSHTYYIEPKQTPEFYMSGKAIPAENAKCSLMIGDTVHFSFDKVDESKFSTPQNPQYVSYVHNSTNHTGVLTAETAGEETILFSQTGTALINAGSRSVHVYVSRHPVNLTKVLNNGTWKVDSVYTGDVYSITEGDGVHALNTVSVTSSDEKVLKYEDGGWKAVGAGTARLTISHAQTDYWAAETLYTDITVEKYTPEFTWNLPATVNYNRSFANPVSSTNTMEGCTFSYQSGDASVINYVNGSLRTFEKAGNNVSVQVTQAGNYKWNEHAETFYVKVEKLADHVPFTMNTKAIRDAVYSGKANKGSISCSESGTITLDQNGGIIIATANALYYDIHFSGIPNSVTFKYQQSMASSTALGPTGKSFVVYQKGETGDWSALWDSNGAKGDKNEHAVTIHSDKLSPSTRYLRFYFDGTYTGYYKSITVTERTEVTGAKTVDFGEADASSDPTEKSTNINWYNVNPLTLTIEGTNASQFTVDKSSIEAKKDSFAENVSLKLTYKHDRAAVKDTATLVISDGTTTKKIGLKGVTNKITPAITWKENLTPMQRGVGVKNPATAPVTLVYTSTDSTVVDIIGDSIVPLKKGTATITASFDGTNDGVYNSTSSTKDVEVTDVKVQHINWTQNFKRLKWTDKEELSDKNTADFALVATVSYYDVDKEEEITIDRPITFTSNNDEVVQVLNGTTLHVVGIGETTLTAHVEGIADSLYEATVTRDVKVREPSLDCDIFVLDNASCKMTTSITDVTGTEQVFPLGGEPEFLTFSAWREAIKVVIEYSKGNLFVAQKVNGNWVDLVPDGLELDKDKSKDFGPYELNRKATDIKFYKKTGATGHHLISGADVTLARYVEFKNGKDTAHVTFTKEDAKPGVAKEKSVKVKYSNITDQLEFKMKGGENSKFSVVSPAAIGNECGDKGEATVTIKFLSNDVATYKDTLLIQNLNQTVTVYLEAEVDKHHQQITWNPATTDLKTTDNVTFDATTTGSSAGLSVRYSVKEGSDVASVNATTGALTILKDGSVTIQVDADGDGATYYDAKPVSKTFIISKVKPTIDTIPTAATMTLPNTSLADCDLSDGEASVDGKFTWEDKTINATYNNSGYKVVFTPTNTNWYDTASCVVVVPVEKQANTITWNFNVTEMFCNAQYAFTGANAATATCDDPAVYYTTSDESIAYVDDAKNLKIIKGGIVTITAKQDGNDTYAAATPVAKTFTIKRFAPEIVVMPTVAPMKIGRLLSDASLTGGRAELGGAQVEGAFAWVDGNTTTMNVAGTFSKQIVFAPSNKNYYDSVYAMLDVVVQKYAPVIEHTLQGSAITYGQALSLSNISGSLTATDTVKLPNIEVAGTYTWRNSSEIVNAGNPSMATVRFTPENTDWYDAVDFEVPVNVAKAEPVLNVTASEIVIGQKLSQSNLTNDGTSGTCAWDPSLNAETTVYNVEGDYKDLPFVFTSTDPNYTNGTGVVTLHVNVGYVFNGNADGDWTKGSNWQDGNQPGETDNVLVNADVVIDGPITVGSLTIAEGVDVIVKDGGSLTINGSSLDRTTYGNIHVENGGNLNCGGGEIKVKDFILDASLSGLDADENNASAKSGQITGEEALTITGEAYFKMDFDPSGKISYGWYDFVVPFDVNISNGIFRVEKNGAITPMTNGVDFRVQSFSEERCATGSKAWTNFSGTMLAGQAYTITFNYQPNFDQNTFLFKKKAGATIGGSNNYAATRTNQGATENQGWNALGNGTLRYVELTENLKIQIFEHSSNSYKPFVATQHTIAVGTAFQVQVENAQNIMMAAATSNRPLLAPKYAGREVDEFLLSLTAEGAANEADRMWVSASEEANGEYWIGHDLLKKGTMTSSTVARMWSERGGKNLCDIEMQLVDDAANCAMGLFAPAVGTYYLAVEEAPEDATLYLTYNGNIIWDLSASPYMFDLAKGTTTGYGLRIEAKKTPAIMTGVDNADANGQKARKVVIDDQMYIITPEGAMYNVSGKIVR